MAHASGWCDNAAWSMRTDGVSIQHDTRIQTAFQYNKANASGRRGGSCRAHESRRSDIAARRTYPDGVAGVARRAHPDDVTSAH